MELARREKEKYEKLYKLFPEYNTDKAAEYLSQIFFTLFYEQMKHGDRVLDFGCGRGASARIFLPHNLFVHLLDITANSLAPDIHFQTLIGNCQFTEACLWDIPETVPSAEWVLCLDVLEHIPERKIDAVLSHIAQRMKKGGIVKIALKEDNWGQSIGEILHLTVRPVKWWKEKLSLYFRQEEISKTNATQYTTLIYPL